MTVEHAQPRLLQPPRIANFCPALHCGRACGPEDCNCKPCGCQRCKRQTARAGRLVLKPESRPVRAPQPRLFSLITPERSRTP